MSKKHHIGVEADLGRERELVLHEWEIWHTYTTFFAGHLPPLCVAAHNLVESGIAEAAVLNDGVTHWRKGDAVSTGQTDVRMEPGKYSATINFPANPRNAYAVEGMYQSGYLRYGERKLFGDDNPLPQPYLRVLLGRCTLSAGERQSVLYPVLKMYESGVAMVALRMLSPEQPVGLHEFISRYLNAPMRGYETLCAPPAIVQWAPSADRAANAPRLRHRWRSVRDEKLHAMAVRQQTSAVAAGDFDFEEAPLSGGVGQHKTLSSLALTLLSTCWFAAHGPRTGAKALFRGQVRVPGMGGYWTGRPHVHLIRFSNQRHTAVENEQTHRSAFGAILARCTPDDLMNREQFLPENSRSLGDTGAYIGQSGTLWVHSRSSLAAVKEMQRPDANHAHLVYEHHAKVEMLEHVYALHRRIVERVRRHSYSVSEALDEQRELVDLELQMAEAGKSGEIRALLAHGWTAWSVDRLRDTSSRLLAIRQAEDAHHQGQRANRATAYLAFVAAILAFPQIATTVIRPAWERLWPWPAGQWYADAVYLLATTVVLGLIVLLGQYAVARRRLWKSSR